MAKAQPYPFVGVEVAISDGDFDISAASLDPIDPVDGLRRSKSRCHNADHDRDGVVLHEATVGIQKFLKFCIQNVLPAAMSNLDCDHWVAPRSAFVRQCPAELDDMVVSDSQPANAHYRRDLEGP